MADLVSRQAASTKLVLNNSPVKKIFVDGGFSRNPVFINLLQAEFPGIEIFSSTIAQASALGAALVMHRHRNKNEVPENIIKLIAPA